MAQDRARADVGWRRRHGPALRGESCGPVEALSRTARAGTPHGPVARAGGCERGGDRRHREERRPWRACPGPDPAQDPARRRDPREPPRPERRPRRADGPGHEGDGHPCGPRRGGPRCRHAPRRGLGRGGAGARHPPRHRGMLGPGHRQGDPGLRRRARRGRRGDQPGPAGANVSARFSSTCSTTGPVAPSPAPWPSTATRTSSPFGIGSSTVSRGLRPLLPRGTRWPRGAEGRSGARRAT